MAKRGIVMLAIGVVFAAVCPRGHAQAVAESAVMHANSGMSAGVAKALGGHIEQSLSRAGSQFSYPPRTARGAKLARTRRGKIRSHVASRPPIAISSVVGGPAPCVLSPHPASPQAKPAPNECAGKIPAVRNANNITEITVSF
jgi:hypothetical protein